MGLLTGENDNLMVNKLIANPDAVGVFTVSLSKCDKLKGANVDNCPTLITLPRVSIH